ncbi:hypothetical protein [Hyphomicrobium sulfonivorans]|uniref:hypothetical protein n=1 Tax=Hyphomicrobium sulfonivorans TaxID=121290 RepID=UPI0015710E4D|nr:hypothetical protein [Hyphomicrobium sulfonivorans]MBI1648862.1 hypothetical protein [Hyphomicrobium sulfonivorans]
MDTLQASRRSLPRAEEDDLRAFLNSIAEFDDHDLTAVLEALKKAKPKTKAAKNGTPKAPKKPANLDEAAVIKYVQELRSAQTPEAVAAILQNMKSVKVPETKAIANRFRGFEAKFRSGKEALAAIEAWALTDMRAQSRKGKIGEIF